MVFLMVWISKTIVYTFLHQLLPNHDYFVCEIQLIWTIPTNIQQIPANIIFSLHNKLQ